MREATLKVFRGDKESGDFKTYKVPVEEGMVVLDAIHYIQAHMEPDLQGSKMRLLQCRS
jgi:succinate dehydrogenase / fumarate reductase iron-sulfur subunit